MTWPGIEPWSSELPANTLTIIPMGQYKTLMYLFIYLCLGWIHIFYFLLLLLLLFLLLLIAMCKTIRQTGLAILGKAISQREGQHWSQTLYQPRMSPHGSVRLITSQPLQTWGKAKSAVDQKKVRWYRDRFKKKFPDKIKVVQSIFDETYLDDSRQQLAKAAITINQYARKPRSENMIWRHSCSSLIWI